MLNVNTPRLYLPSLVTTKAVTFTGSNTTVNTNLFSITGSVKVNALYGIVTTAIGVNHTAAYWDENDATAQVAISLATGTTLSAAPAGSIITRNSLVSVALALSSAAAGAVQDPVAATATDSFMPFIIVQKTGSVATYIRYTYTTTDTPTTGAITFYIEWRALTPGSSLAAA